MLDKAQFLVSIEVDTEGTDQFSAAELEALLEDTVNDGAVISIEVKSCS